VPNYRHTVEQIRGHAPTDAWCVALLDATTFGNRNRSPRGPPVDVVRSLHGDGTPSATARLRDPLGGRQCRAIWVTDLDGRKRDPHTSGLTVSGYLGRVRTMRRQDGAPGFGALLQFAEFAGLGRYTVRGSESSPEQTWHTSSIRVVHSPWARPPACTTPFTPRRRPVSPDGRRSVEHVSTGVARGRWRRLYRGCMPCLFKGDDSESADRVAAQPANSCETEGPPNPGATVLCRMSTGRVQIPRYGES